MASSIINSDDGVISGTSGIKTTGGDDGVLVFQSKGTETARITTDNYLRLASGGIQFNGDTAAANALDDYEEGTFTVEAYDASTGGNQSPTTGTGYYTKIGQQVIAQMNIVNVDTTGMTAGNVIYFTLPFTANANNTSRAPGTAIIRVVTFPAGYTSVSCYISSSGTRGVIEMSGSGVNSTGIKVSDLSSGVSDMWFNYIYNAD